MFFYRAQRRGTWDKMQRMLVKKTRVAKGKKENPTYALIDLQSVKTTSASDKRGYDGGKKERKKAAHRGGYDGKSPLLQ